MTMKLRRKLFNTKDPYDGNTAGLFLASCRENFDYLISHCEDYGKIAKGLGINSSSDIRKVSDIPVIPTMLFKQHDLRSGRQ